MSAGSDSLTPLSRCSLDHVGMTVADVDVALAFWEPFLEAEPAWRAILDQPYLGRNVGYPGVVIDAAVVELPCGGTLELLSYRGGLGSPNPEATANPGNVHVCLEVDDAASAWSRAVKLGARPVVPDGPLEVDGGPTRGAKAAYLRIHDGITLELVEWPRRRGEVPASAAEGSGR